MPHIRKEISTRVYERPGKEDLQESSELHKQVDNENLVQRYLPKEADMYEILKIMQRMVLRGKHLTHFSEDRSK